MNLLKSIAKRLIGRNSISVIFCIVLISLATACSLTITSQESSFLTSTPSATEPISSSKEISSSEKSFAEKIEEIVHSLNIPSQTDTDITLPSKGSYHAEITWESSNETILTRTGKIFPLSVDITITLTAKIYLEQEMKEISFQILILGIKEEMPNINYTEDYVYEIDANTAEKYSYYKGYRYAGLLNKDGSDHNEFKENAVTGYSLNVLLFGAKANDESFDNTPVFINAIQACSPGDEVYIPKGKYYFSTPAITTPYYAHISLKTGVNLRGAGREDTILISNYQNKEYIDKTNGKKTATLVCGNMSNAVISNLSFSANTDDSCLPPSYNDTTVNNPNGNQYAPAFGIVVYGMTTLYQVEQIMIKNVFIEYFQYDGIRLYCTRNCLIKNSIITKATDIGGGGAGYGIEIRGYGHERFEYIDTKMDSCYNIVENVTILGPYIRHGIILSYMTHNNLFYNNRVIDSADDAYDIHGQDEFLNVFVKNFATGSRRGAGLGLGNTGSSHDESGYGNVLYKNRFENCKYGITVTRGTKYTQLIQNTITNCTNGIYLNNAPNTYEEKNIIS